MGDHQGVAGDPMVTGHIFDGGLVVPQRTIIEQGIAELLAPMTRARGGYLLDVFTIGCVVRSYTDERGIAQLAAEINGRTPTIAVATADRSFENTGIGGQDTMSTIDILLYFCSQHSRGLHMGRLEQDSLAQRQRQADPGLYTMMQHAASLLLGRYTSSEALKRAKTRQLRPQREEELATADDMTIWMQTWTVQAYLHANDTEWAVQPKLLSQVNARITTDPGEANRPAPATSSTTLDLDIDIDPVVDT